MNATEYLIEAFRANKRGDLQPELNKLQAVADAAWTGNGPALDLPALLSALAEIVVGEPCVSVPVREVNVMRAMNEAWIEYDGGDDDRHLDLAAGLSNAADAILAYLPAPNVDPIAELRDLLKTAKTNAENCRARDISGAEWWDTKIGPLEAAIAKMEKP